MSVEDRSNGFFMTVQKHGESPWFSQCRYVTSTDVDGNVLTFDVANMAINMIEMVKYGSA